MSSRILLVLLSIPQVWNHFDSGSCPGQAIGVKTRLDNGVTGFIPTKFLSDKVVKRPEERVKVDGDRAQESCTLQLPCWAY